MRWLLKWSHLPITGIFSGLTSGVAISSGTVARDWAKGTQIPNSAKISRLLCLCGKYARHDLPDDLGSVWKV
jgi:hypothetical protein